LLNGIHRQRADRASDRVEDWGLGGIRHAERLKKIAASDSRQQSGLETPDYP
jgi:hypothetical protein